MWNSENFYICYDFFSFFLFSFRSFLLQSIASYDMNAYSIKGLNGQLNDQSFSVAHQCNGRISLLVTCAARRLITVREDPVIARSAFSGDSENRNPLLMDGRIRR